MKTINETREHEIIQKECTCTICGSKLDFTHMIDYGRNVVREFSTCSDCGVRFEATDHSIN